MVKKKATNNSGLIGNKKIPLIMQIDKTIKVIYFIVFLFLNLIFIYYLFYSWAFYNNIFGHNVFNYSC